MQYLTPHRLVVALCALFCASGCNLSDPIQTVPPGNDVSQNDTSMTDTDASDGDDRDGSTGDAGDMGPSTDVAQDAAPDVPIDMGPPPLEFEAYCTQVSTIRVAWLRECFNNEYYDPMDQELIASLSQGCLDAAPLVDDGSLVFDPEGARECLEALEEETCDYRRFLTDVPACEGVVTGQVELGGSCHAAAGWHVAVDDECTEGFCLNDACPGTCTAYAVEGEPCGGFPNISCDPAADLWCDFQTETCASRAGEGEPCVGVPCGTGLTCTQMNGERVCTAAADLGETCDVNDDRCIAGTFCSDSVCTSKADAGQSCRYDYQCSFGQSCLDQDGAGSSNAPGICRAKGGDGAVCYRSSDCQNNLLCNQNICVERPRPGEACINNACAQDAWCRHETMGDTGVCLARGAQDDPCSHGYGPASVYEACQEDLFCIEGVCQATSAAGEPCHPGVNQTCDEGLFCNRTNNTCSPLAADGEPCNPWWYPRSCAEGLGCACADGATDCNRYEIDANPGDTCAPALDVGEPCSRSAECESNSCWDPEQTGTSTCQPGTCLP